MVLAMGIQVHAQNKPTTTKAPTTKPPVTKAPTAQPPTSKAPTSKPPLSKPAPQKPAAVVLKNASDSLSYAIGVLDGNFFKTQGISAINPDALAKGFEDAMSSKTLCTPEQADSILRSQMQKMVKAKIQPNIEEGEKFLKENAKKPGIKLTGSGLQYEVITEGTGPKPAMSDNVKVHYEGFLLNGKKFDSSKDRGEPTSFPLNQVIRGWTEGVQLMSVGSKYKFYIPYQLAYGEQGAGADIPGGSTLIFEVELIEIVKSNQ